MREKQADILACNYWNEIIKESSAGYNIAIKFLETNHNIFDNIELKENEKITLDNCLIKDSDLEVISNIENVNKIISGSTTLQEFWKKPASVLIVFYIVAQILFAEKKFNESHAIFSFLTLLNQNIQSFWIGMGMTNESLENWDKALGDYWMAQSIDSEKITAYEGLIRIYKKLDDQNALHDCCEVIKNYPNLQDNLMNSIQKDP